MLWCSNTTKSFWRQLGRMAMILQQLQPLDSIFHTLQDDSFLFTILFFKIIYTRSALLTKKRKTFHFSISAFYQFEFILISMNKLFQCPSLAFLSTLINTCLYLTAITSTVHYSILQTLQTFFLITSTALKSAVNSVSQT